MIATGDRAAEKVPVAADEARVITHVPSNVPPFEGFAVVIAVPSHAETVTEVAPAFGVTTKPTSLVFAEVTIVFPLAPTTAADPPVSVLTCVMVPPVTEADASSLFDRPKVNLPVFRATAVPVVPAIR